MKSAQSAFTLLEILIALAILSIVMVSTVINSGRMISNVAYLKEKSFAHWVAMNKAAQLRLSKNWLPPGKTNGTTMLANINWEWQVQVNDTSDKGLGKANITVTRKDDGIGAQTILTLYFARPSGR